MTPEQLVERARNIRDAETPYSPAWAAAAEAVEELERAFPALRQPEPRWLSWTRDHQSTKECTRES